ncbi:hypothetical protein BDAP_000072 [Binucleata daphniae]
MDKPIIEDCNSSELSSEDIKHYTPTNMHEELEVDESVYSLHEYINLEWPSQTVDTSNKKLLVATNSKDNDGELIELNFANTKNFKNVDKYTQVQTKVTDCYNRVRYFGPNVIAISDNKIVVFDKNLDEIKNVEDSFAYGLATSGKIYTGLKNGKVNCYDNELNKIDEYVVHTDAVESICVHNNILYTASCDKSAASYDTRSNQKICMLNNDCDVNAIDYNKENYVITGDDKGVVRLYDIRTNKELEKIEWHKSAISYVKWKSQNEFVSCSDEQIAIWDTSYEEEWEYHKYLRFVHQGQKYYKEVAFFGDVYVATSYDGLCLFSLNIDNIEAE